jgi:hypothetical protein
VIVQKRCRAPAAETVIPIVFGCVFLLLVIGFACMYTTS